MHTVKETYEKIVQLVSDDGHYKVDVEYDGYDTASEAYKKACNQVEEYEKSARSVLLSELEARKVIMRWEREVLMVPAGLNVEQADEFRAKKRQEEGFSVGRLADNIFDDDRMDGKFYIFAPASDADVRDFCVLLSMCGAALSSSVNQHKYCYYCGQAQLKKGSRYVVQIGGDSDFPNIEWVSVIDLDVLMEGVKAMAEFVKNFK